MTTAQEEASTEKSIIEVVVNAIEVVPVLVLVTAVWLSILIEVTATTISQDGAGSSLSPSTVIPGITVENVDVHLTPVLKTVEAETAVKDGVSAFVNQDVIMEDTVVVMVEDTVVVMVTVTGNHYQISSMSLYPNMTL